MAKSENKIYQIGVMASESIEMSAELKIKAMVIGKEIAMSGQVLITGGGRKGVPLVVAKSAKSAGGKVIAITPGFSPVNFRYAQKKESDIFDVIIQTGLSSSPVEKNSIGLDYLNINSCDAVIFIGGKLGTLAEFLVALKADKVIGVLDNSGGMSKYFIDIARGVGKHITVSARAEVLVRKIIKRIER